MNTPGGLLFADLKLEVFGYEGGIKSASYSKFDGGNANDYSGWTALGAAKAASSGSELEAQVWMGQDTGLARSSEASILFYMRDANGQEDYSDFTVGMTTGVLAIQQREPVLRGGELQLDLTVTAYGMSEINMTSMAITKLGSGGGGSLTLSSPGNPSQFFGGVTTFTGIVTFPQEQPRSLTVSASGASGTYSMAVASQTAVTASGRGHSVHVSVSGYSNSLFNPGGGVAGNIVIDGAFEDWSATQNANPAGFHYRSDTSDDVEEAPKAGSPGLVERGGLAHYQDPNVNLQAIAEYDPGGGTLYYFAQVEGQALGGQVVPATKRALPGPPGTGTSKPPTHVGSDVLYVLVDDDGNRETGFPVMSGQDILIGAKYCIVVTGKNGAVIESKTYNYDNGWREGGPSGFALAGGKKIEVSVSNIATTSNHKAMIIAEDWTSNADRSDGAIGGSGRGRDVTTLTVNEVDISRHAVRVGSNDNPMFRLDLEAEGGPVEVSSVEIARDGTALDTDISAVHLTVDSDGNGMPSTTDSEVAGATRFVDGKAVFDLAPQLVVDPGQAKMLFVSIDVSGTAKLYGTFGAGVERVESGANFVELVNSRATKDVVLTKTGGRDSITTYVCINEIHFNASGYIDWIELINPTESEVSLKGWTIEAGGGVRDVIYSFADADKISGSNGLKVASITIWAIHTGTQVGLFTGVTEKDSLTPTAYGSDPHSYARYRDASDYPTTEKYNAAGDGTPSEKNNLIPEFQDIIIPLMGVVGIFAVIRQRNGARKRRRQKA